MPDLNFLQLRWKLLPTGFLSPGIILLVTDRPLNDLYFLITDRNAKQIFLLGTVPVRTAPRRTVSGSFWLGLPTDMPNQINMKLPTDVEDQIHILVPTGTFVELNR